MNIKERVKKLGLVEKPEPVKNVKEVIERNERGQITYYKDSSGFESWYEYDKAGNEIYYKNSDGFESWYEYDKVGNEITHYKNSDGYESWYEYDKNGNEINRLIFENGKYYLNEKELISK